MTDEEITRITETYYARRGNAESYGDISDFCKTSAQKRRASDAGALVALPNRKRTIGRQMEGLVV